MLSFRVATKTVEMLKSRLQQICKFGHSVQPCALSQHPCAPASMLPNEEQGLCTFLAVLNSSHRASDILELATNAGSLGLEKACRIWEFEQLVCNNVLIHFLNGLRNSKMSRTLFLTSGNILANR